MSIKYGSLDLAETRFKEELMWSPQFLKRVRDAIIRRRKGESDESIRRRHGGVVLNEAKVQLTRRPDTWKSGERK